MTKNRIYVFLKELPLFLTGQWEESTDKWLGRNKAVIEESWDNTECFIFIFNP